MGDLSLLGRKLRIYAMLLRLEEIQNEQRMKVLLLESKQKPMPILEINEVKHHKIFFEPKIHPKHQQQNKFRKHK